MLLLGSILALIVSFYLLAQVSDKYFIESLDRIARKLKMSHDMAGATLMAIGSSAPELFVAIIALVKPGDHAEIGIGTIVGSAVFNVLAIIGAVAIVKRSFLAWQPILRDLIFYCMALIILILTFYDGVIEIWEAAIYVLFYGGYIWAVIGWRKLFPYEDMDEATGVDYDATSESGGGLWEKVFKPFDFVVDKLFPPIKYYYSVFIISIVFIALLSWVLVESAIVISEILRVPKVIIALTVLAIGTSVPDMISSVIVAKQGRGGMALSNAVGSNIFDILIGLGLPWFFWILIKDQTVPVVTNDLFVSVVFLFGSVLVILVILLINNWVIGRKSGLILIGLYLIFLIRELSRVI